MEARDRNPFMPETLKEQKARNERKQQAIDAAEAAMNAARSCINTKEFKEYRDKYFKAEQLLIEQIMEFKEHDPLRYGFEMANMVGNLRALKRLLKEVHSDARTKPNYNS